MIPILTICTLVLSHLPSSSLQERNSVSREKGSTSAGQLIASLKGSDYPTVSEDGGVQGQANH